VYNFLTENVKKRIIFELRKFWSYDPVYRDDLVPHIQQRYSFRERPCMAIIVKGGSANHFMLSASNFQGTVVSHCHLTKVGDKPGLAIEWVREDTRAIIENRGTFPSPPGIYYIEIRQETVEVAGVVADYKVFYVDPLLDVLDEQPLQLSAFQYQLANAPYHPGSLRLFELPGNIPLVEGVNYTVDATTGIITLINVLPPRISLSADYRYPGETTGPHLIRDNHTHVQAIPGVVLAFGRRGEAGDIMAVIVNDRREEVALEYGGRWDVTLDMDIMAKDLVAQGEITDKTMLYLHGVARNRLASEGIEITQVSMGGEAEEAFDENADDYFYTASISVNLQTDWSIHVPLTGGVRRVSAQTQAQAIAAAGMTDDELIKHESNNLKLVQDLNLTQIADPFFVGRNKTYEVIK